MKMRTFLGRGVALGALLLVPSVLAAAVGDRTDGGAPIGPSIPLGAGGACSPIVVDGTLGSGSPSWPSVSGTQTGRLNRNGIASSCATPKSCLQFDSTPGRAFDGYSFTNDSGATACVSVTLDVLTQANCNLQVDAYDGSFDPANICTNYLADPGLSSGIPPTQTTMSFNVAAGDTFVLDVHTTNPGETGCLYDLTVTGDICAAGCALTCPADANVGNDPGQCGAIVNYPPPQTTGTCGTVTCTPPSGGFFAVGTTNVDCVETLTTTTTTVYSSGNVAVPIPATGTSGQMTPQVLSIPDPGTVTDVNLRLRANHTFDADLEVTLEAPDGTTTTLVMDDNGGSGDNLGSGATDCSGTKTIFDDEALTSITAGAAPFAGSFIPLNPLANMDGQTATGNWTLRINDDLGGDSGTLFCWELEITRQVTGGTGATCGFQLTVNDTEPPIVTCPADITLDLPPGSNGQNVDYPPPAASDNCPGVGADCQPPSGDLFPAGQTPVVCTALDSSQNSAACTFLVNLGAVTVLEVPTVSSLGLLALALLLAAAAFVALRRNG